MINGHDLCIAGESAKFGMPEVIRGSYGAVATSTLFHSGIPTKKAFYIQLTGRNLTAAQAERIGLVSEVVPDDQLDAAVAQLANELGGRNAVTLESAKIAAYMQKDMDFATALKNRRPGIAPHAVLHQSAERCGRLSAFAKGRRHHWLCETGGSEKITSS